MSAIPSWNPRGIIPPYTAGTPAAGGSPYNATISDVVARFGDTTERRMLLTGLLDFRSALAAFGIQNGFQWIDGSFVEHAEVSRGRPPADVDVVTFFEAPSALQDQQALTDAMAANSLFDAQCLKTTYGVEGYFVPLMVEPRSLVFMVNYWCGLFSHRRVDDMWKGMVEVDLSVADDLAARLRLSELNAI